MESPYDKKRQFIINAVYILLIAAIVYLIFQYAISLLSPFILAFLIAYLLKGPAKRFPNGQNYQISWSHLSWCWYFTVVPEFWSHWWGSN
jgi:hypothetical protein